MFLLSCARDATLRPQCPVRGFGGFEGAAARGQCSQSRVTRKKGRKGGSRRVGPKTKSDFLECAAGKGVIMTNVQKAVSSHGQILKGPPL